MKKNGPKKKKIKIINSIIGGKAFKSELFIKNTRLLLLIALYAFIYVSNRYIVRQERNYIRDLKSEVVDMRYQLLTRQSELSEESRQSNIEEQIIKNNSKLKAATNPPFFIKK